jgi:hypothetical protein
LQSQLLDILILADAYTNRTCAVYKHIIGSDGQTLSYLWNFGDPNANARNPIHQHWQAQHITILCLEHTIQLSVTTSNGCTKDSTFTAAFSETNFIISIDAGLSSATGTVSVATATVTNGVPGSGIYYGTATDAAGSFNPSTAGAGTHTVWYKFTSTANCIDSISQTILVRAKPVVAFTNTSGCLPVNGQMQFTNASTISDAQTLNYVWNFGDALNINAVTLHNYTGKLQCKSFSDH